MGGPTGVRPSTWLAWAGLAALVALIAATALDYGYSVDEEPSQAYGAIILEGYGQALRTGNVRGSLGDALRSAQQATFRAIEFRGVTFHMFTEWFAHLSGLGELAGRRVFTPVVGLLGVVGCFWLTRLLAGRAAALWAALLLVLTPTWYGHAFINPADIPFAVGHVWTLYFIVRIHREGEAASRTPWVLFGVCLGLTLTTRFGGILLLAYLGLALLVETYPRSGAGDWRARGNELVRLLVRGYARRLALGLGVALAVAYCLWPAALLDPLGFPARALADTQSHPLQRMVLLGGELHRSGELPRSYQLHYLAIKLPLLHLALVATAATLGVRRLIVARRGAATQAPERGVWIVWLSVLFPLVYAVLTRPTDYDAIRHFVFLLPPLACLCGITLARLLSAASSRGPRPKWAAWAALVAMLASVAHSMVAIHPYQYIYYNALVGGVRGASGNYLDDYWGTAFKEAMEELDQKLRAEAGGEVVPRRLAACGPSRKSPTWTAEHFLPEGMSVTQDPRLADFYLTVSKWPCRWRIPEGSRPYVIVEREGAPLAVVVDNRDRPQAGPSPQGAAPGRSVSPAAAPATTPPTDAAPHAGR